MPDRYLYTPARLFADSLGRVAGMAADLGLAAEAEALAAVLRAHETGRAEAAAAALSQALEAADNRKLAKDPLFPPPGWTGRKRARGSLAAALARVADTGDPPPGYGLGTTARLGSDLYHLVRLDDPYNMTALCGVAVFALHENPHTRPARVCAGCIRKHDALPEGPARVPAPQKVAGVTDEPAAGRAARDGGPRQ